MRFLKCFQCNKSYAEGDEVKSYLMRFLETKMVDSHMFKSSILMVHCGPRKTA